MQGSHSQLWGVRARPDAHAHTHAHARIRTFLNNRAVSPGLPQGAGLQVVKALEKQTAREALGEPGLEVGVRLDPEEEAGATGARVGGDKWLWGPLHSLPAAGTSARFFTPGALVSKYAKRGHSHWARRGGGSTENPWSSEHSWCCPRAGVGWCRSRGQSDVALGARTQVGMRSGKGDRRATGSLLPRLLRVQPVVAMQRQGISRCYRGAKCH